MQFEETIMILCLHKNKTDAGNLKRIKQGNFSYECPVECPFFQSDWIEHIGVKRRPAYLYDV